LRLCVVLGGLAAVAVAKPTSLHAAPRTTEEASAVNAVFLSGLAALDSGRPDLAIPAFRSILARHPDLLRVRLELGRAYFENRQWGEARREFTLVLSADIPRAVRRNVLIYIRRIDARRGFDWQLDLASRKIGDDRDFDSDTIYLDIAGETLPFEMHRRTESEIGIAFEASARRSLRIADLGSGRLATTAFAEPFAFGEHTDAIALRDHTYGLEAGVQAATPRITAALAVVAQRRDVGGRGLESRIGLEGRAERRSGTGLSVFGRAGWTHVDDLRSDARDGHETRGAVGVNRSLRGRGSVGASLFGSFRRTDGGFDDHDRFGVSVSGSLEAAYGLRIEAAAYAAWRDFPRPNPAFVEDPDSTETGITMRVAKADWFLVKQLMPYIEASATRVDSGIEAFSYHTSDIAIGVEKAF